MTAISHKDISLTIDGASGDVEIKDLRRNHTWRLDQSTVRQRDRDGKPLETGACTVSRVSPERIEVIRGVGDNKIEVVWTLRDDHVEAELRSCPDTVQSVSLPGFFRPSEGAHHTALPFYQGVLCRKSGTQWEDSTMSAGHGAWSMAMGAVIGERGALLVTQETTTDWMGVRGESESGPYFFFEQTRCDVEGWTSRSVRIYPVDKDITTICRRYRARVKERGAFVSWEEKIEHKPVVKDLFGALMAFIGYNATDQVDYVACAKKIRAMGFDKAFYYPARMCAYSMDFKMGGDDPIWLSDETIASLRNIGGVHLSPWMWSVEALNNPGTDVERIGCRTREGKLAPTWQIDKQIWYIVCTPYEIEHVAGRLSGDMKEMGWIHYDVGAQRPGKPCHSTEHDLHPGKALGMREAHQWSQKLLGWKHNGNRVVSAEGFVDHFTRAYDIGSTKVIPTWGESSFIPVPMTMLVFHDSCIHDWWEVDNYNKLPFTHPCNRFGTAQSGWASKKAAMDALYGCPPNVFPFGKQYAWANFETKETFSFTINLDDAEVQHALQAALPVCRLHKDIGMQDLLSFEALTDDYAVQSTVFADGTRVVANISDAAREYDGGVLEADSWKRVGG